MTRILIADDSKFMRGWLKIMVEQHGYHVIAEAKNGQEAIEYYINYQPDIVLLDITMDNKDGLTVLTEIINIDSYAKIIMCSSLGSQLMMIDAINMGARDFIVKPQFHKLIQTLKRVELEQIGPN